MRVRIYVEGGGDSDRTQTACRKAFSILLGRTLTDLPKPRIVVCGGRNQAFKAFGNAVLEPEGVTVLLVDSEEPVQPGANATDHLRSRDRWKNPGNSDGKQIHLMVQCMETWLLADIETLRRYFGKNFRDSALPTNPRIEEIPKREAIRGLESAAAQTAKSTYHKTRDGFEILSLIDPEKIRSKSPFAEKFFAAVITYCSLS